MKITIALVVIAGVAAITPMHSTLWAQQATSRSVSDGVYTEEQAKRGEAVYGQTCASCHGQALMGTEMAPPLTGADFKANWYDLTVGDLSEKIRLAMPADDPGSIKKEQTADVVAYMLSVNKYPAGQTELPTDTDLLKQIKIERPAP